jgi:Cu+-exporting ATPase
MFTGESIPVEKGEGEPVLGATVNQNGLLVVKATAIGEDTALARIVSLVEEAQAGKAPVQRLADRVSAIFVPIVILIAIGTLIVWLLLGNAATEAVRAPVAVLIIACPCALGLATPTAIMVGSGRGAELGILFKNPEVFERAQAIDAVLLDKTGTLTTGAMTLTDFIAEDESDRFLRLVASVEAAPDTRSARQWPSVPNNVEFGWNLPLLSRPSRGWASRERSMGPRCWWAA